MAIFNSVFTWFMKKRIHQIELFMKYPNEVQEEWFEQLISGAEKTEWGKKYQYKSISNLHQFKQRVPIQNYDTLKPYIERMLKGEQNVLWHSGITLVCQIIRHYQRPQQIHPRKRRIAGRMPL